MAFPVSTYKDMLDAASRLFDLDVLWPKLHEEVKRYDKKRGSSDWMSA
jgi:hypothetical protein